MLLSSSHWPEEQPGAWDEFDQAFNRAKELVGDQKFTDIPDDLVAQLATELGLAPQFAHYLFAGIIYPKWEPKMHNNLQSS